MKAYFQYLILGILTGILFSSCERADGNTIDEVIHIRHEGADMPAYVHGNSEGNTFLLVLHGAGSYGLAFRDGAFTSELEERCVVVYWDQRAQGMSQGKYEKPGDLIGLMASDVMALVAVLKEKYGEDISIFLMGHSWGGLLGNTVLLDGDNQEAFRGWIAVDALHDVPFGSRSRRGLMLSIADEQIGLGNQSADWETLKKDVMLLDSLSDDDYQPTLQYAQRTMSLLLESGVVAPSVSGEKIYRAVFDNNPVTWLVSAFFNQPVNTAIEQDYSLTSRLSGLSLPVLYLHGKYDVSVPPVLAEDAFRRISSSDKKLVVFEHSIHHPHDTEPGLFASEVINFIERNR